MWVIFQDPASKADAQREEPERSASGKLRGAKLRMITLEWAYSLGSRGILQYRYLWLDRPQFTFTDQS